MIRPRIPPETADQYDNSMTATRETRNHIRDDPAVNREFRPRIRPMRFAPVAELRAGQ